MGEPCSPVLKHGDAGVSERAEGEALAADLLLPLVPGLLAQGDPMPLFTLKLTCAVLDAAPTAAVPVLQRRGAPPRSTAFPFNACFS